MDAIRKKMNEYIEDLLVKDHLTLEEYAVLNMEYERRKSESKKNSDDTIMRIFRTIG